MHSKSHSAPRYSSSTATPSVQHSTQAARSIPHLAFACHEPPHSDSSFRLSFRRRPRAAMPRCPGTALRRRQALPAPALATACGVTLLRAAWVQPGACGGVRCRIPLGCRRRHQSFLLFSSFFSFPFSPSLPFPFSTNLFFFIIRVFFLFFSLLLLSLPFLFSSFPSPFLFSSLFLSYFFFPSISL